MISLGERIAIIMPSIFFNIIILVKMISDVRLIIEVEDTTALSPKILINTLMPHFYLVFFIDFIFLSVTNGLSIIFVLKQSELGVIQLLFGIILIVLGLSFIEMERGMNYMEEYKKSLTEKMFNICIYFSFGQMGYLGGFGINIIKSIPSFYSNWIFFTIFVVIGYIYDRFFDYILKE